MIFSHVVTAPLVLRLRGDPWFDLRDGVVRNQLETAWGAWSTAATVAALVVLIRQKRAPWAAAFQPVLAISAAGAFLTELIQFIPDTWGGFINTLSPLALTTYVAIAASSLVSTSERMRRLVEVLAAAELAVVLACAVSVTLMRISPAGFDFPFQAIGGPRGSPVTLGFAVACAAAYQALIRWGEPGCNRHHTSASAGPPIDESSARLP